MPVLTDLFHSSHAKISDKMTGFVELQQFIFGPFYVHTVYFTTLFHG